MEGESTDSERKENGVTEVQTVTGGNKPLHRFLAGQPRYIGIAIMFFGCNELMLGLPLIRETIMTSVRLYTPFWQGALFMICGSLSIHTHSYPSKKLVTVCLAMYIVTILGGCFTLIFRLIAITDISGMLYYTFDDDGDDAYVRLAQLKITEAVLYTSTIVVIILLICLCCFAKRSLKSSNTQVIMRQVLMVTDTETE
ncbi:membrane-spanning 4-domains subfamily A member 4D-like [Alosa sapidissima]|uniref:membrane-spanning 4-domains subfamily A member 4D-like n=1 Tax=Alosa sapidissima TaxID=34773 RepID=UPI001C095C5B|nr:membrane-spanning 4-domains subfamily A member 4D-like [Alosa sapidissima]